jgi:nitrite reductase/ring-hydroxylating ferredoxin subunit
MTRKYRGAPLTRTLRRRAAEKEDGAAIPGRAARTRVHRAVRYIVCGTDQLKPGESLKFMLPIRGTDEECFAINFAGRFHVYVNRCRHVPMAMDWVENQFFAEEGRYLMCQTHNAYYEPATGECIAGPPTACGKSLYRVPIEISEGVIYATPPEEEFED